MTPFTTVRRRRRKRSAWRPRPSVRLSALLPSSLRQTDWVTDLGRPIAHHVVSLLPPHVRMRKQPREKKEGRRRRKDGRRERRRRRRRRKNKKPERNFSPIQWTALRSSGRDEIGTWALIWGIIIPRPCYAKGHCAKSHPVVLSVAYKDAQVCALNYI